MIIMLNKEKFIKELRNDNAYQYIRNNEQDFTRDDLFTICCELLYGIYDNTTTKENENILDKVAEELEDRL